MKVLVSADTSCLINYEVLKKNGISVFPLNVIVDGKEYLDGVTIDQEFLKNEMRDNKVVKTSTPPLGQVVEYFEKLFKEGYERIIHFTISSKLSSMYDLFCNVSKNYFDDKITVIDSYSVSTLMLSHVLLANEEVKKGTEIEKIVEMVDVRKLDSYVIFVPENLKALKNGGRISPAIAAIGNTLGLKPVIALKEGELVKDSMTKNVRKVFMERLESIYPDYPLEKYDYTIIDFDAKENTLEAINEYLNNLLKDYKVVRGIIPINVCAHCGPGTIGVIVSPKINGKSLNEYL